MTDLRNVHRITYYIACLNVPQPLRPGSHTLPHSEECLPPIDFSRSKVLLNVSESGPKLKSFQLFRILSKCQFISAVPLGKFWERNSDLKWSTNPTPPLWAAFPSPCVLLSLLSYSQLPLTVIYHPLSLQTTHMNSPIQPNNGTTRAGLGPLGVTYLTQGHFCLCHCKIAYTYGAIQIWSHSRMITSLNAVLSICPSYVYHIIGSYSVWFLHCLSPCAAVYT